MNAALQADSRRFTFTGRVRSIRCAVRGIRLMLATQHNAWVHAAATVGAIAMGVALRVTPIEWCVLIIAMVAVWTAEALNTALELLCDVASPAFHPLVEKAKDVAAGAVLIAAAGSVIVGLFVFGPPMLRLVTR
jgi:diacylglycerol kinase (ATP)